jgi:hypothetical protein
MLQDLIRIRKRLDGQIISGLVNFGPAPLGLFVNYDPANLAAPNLIPSTGRGPAYSLMRQVLAAGLSVPLANFVFDRSTIINPVPNGNAVSASRLLEAEVEGPSLLPQFETDGVTALVGAITNATPANTPLSTYNGGLYVAQPATITEGVITAPGDEVIGYLRGQLAPMNALNAARILVQFTE